MNTLTKPGEGVIHQKNLFRITTTFTEIKLIEYQVRKSGAQIRSSSFSDTIVYELAIPDNTTASFLLEMDRLGRHRVRIEPMGVEWAEQ